ncbi:hypothetical protein B0H19DRAFT_1290040 [Mycena capillaripes]|nr:hypothetical protein B0H19DRAFT_1290040 [Mycena capillaripes]
MEEAAAEHEREKETEHIEAGTDPNGPIVASSRRKGASKRVSSGNKAEFVLHRYLGRGGVVDECGWCWDGVTIGYAIGAPSVDEGVVVEHNVVLDREVLGGAIPMLRRDQAWRQEWIVGTYLMTALLVSMSTAARYPPIIVLSLTSVRVVTTPRLVPSKSTTCKVILFFGCIALRNTHPKIIPFFHKLAELACSAALSLFVAKYLPSLIYTLIVSPLLHALFGDTPAEEEEESPDTDSRQRRPAAPWPSATAVGLTLAVSAPLLILRRLSIEPHKRVWSHVFRVCVQISIGTLLYLLAIEGIILYLLRLEASRLNAVLAHLTWQAWFLSHFLTWLDAYAVSILGYLTQKVATYLIARGVARFSPLATLQPGSPSTTPWSHRLIYLAVFIHFPLAMICNGYAFSAPTAAEGLTSAAIIVAWIILGVLTVFLFDLAVYWTYFFWRSRRLQPQPQPGSESQAPSQERSSLIDLMAMTLVEFGAYDDEGRTMWDRMSKEGLEEASSDSATCPEKLEAEEQV